MRKQRRQAPTDDSTNDLDLILSLLSSPVQTSDDNEDDDDDENLREASLLLLRLAYAQACSQLQSMDQEMQLLRSMPPIALPQESADDRKQRRDETDKMWKLDAPETIFQGGQGPLLDPKGRVSGLSVLRFRVRV